jgi:hypothetical protein
MSCGGCLLERTSCSSRTYLPSQRAKLPYARGCGFDFEERPSGASDPASEPKLTHGSASCRDTFSSDIRK